MLEDLQGNQFYEIKIFLNEWMTNGEGNRLEIHTNTITLREIGLYQFNFSGYPFVTFVLVNLQRYSNFAREIKMGKKNITEHVFLCYNRKCIFSLIHFHLKGFWKSGLRIILEMGFKDCYSNFCFVVNFTFIPCQINSLLKGSFHNSTFL